MEAFQPLFRDIALTAGMAGSAGSSCPTTVPVSDGKTAKPGLNMSLETSGEPGHTGWVDKNGVFGLPLKLDSGTPPDVSIAIVLSRLALSPDKGLSLRAVRHEMVHARHKMRVLEAVKAWQSVKGRRRRLRRMAQTADEKEEQPDVRTRRRPDQQWRQERRRQH